MIIRLCARFFFFFFFNDTATTEIYTLSLHDALPIYAGTSVESAPKVVESIIKEFRELKEQQVSDEELRRAKDHLKGSLMLGLESTGSRMSNLARQEMYFGKFFTLDELLESIEIVTAEDVRRIAQTFFDPKQIALTILGNLEKLKIGRDDLGC